MKIENKYKKYLEGTRFSNGVKFKFTLQYQYYDRIEFIKRLLMHRRKRGGGEGGGDIIHLGCCDHIQLINKKIKNGMYLHKIITDLGKNVLGIDNNSRSVLYLTNRLNYNNVICADIVNEAFKVRSEMLNRLPYKKWDYLVAGEVLEHINNPVKFLETIRCEYGKYINKILITVPNAFSIQNFRYALNNCECINTDHRYWFTPYTLAKVMYSAGIKVESIYFTDFKFFKVNLISKNIYKPILGQTIIAIGSF